MYNVASYSVPHHFPDKWKVRIEQSFSKLLLIYQRLSLEMNKQMNQIWESHLKVSLTSKLEFLQKLQ